MTDAFKSRVPVSLEKDPIVEAVFEVRFDSTEQQPADLLIGLLFSKLRLQFPTSRRLPFADIPRPMRDADPKLRFQPLHALEGAGHRILISDKAIALSQLKPYPGWNSFREDIVRLVEAVHQTGIVSGVTRCSLRYLNVLTEGEPNDLKKFRLDLNIADLPLRGPGFALQAEVEREECIAVLQLTSGATVVASTSSEKFATTGFLVTVDTVRQAGLEEFWENPLDFLEQLHRVGKQVFFGLLASDVVSSLGPRWE